MNGATPITERRGIVTFLPLSSLCFNAPPPRSFGDDAIIRRPLSKGLIDRKACKHRLQTRGNMAVYVLLRPNSDYLNFAYT